jgi:hypothetical protein
MRKAVVTMLSLGVLGAVPAGEGAAQVLSTDSLMGRWCTDAGAYLFTPATLTVIRVDGGKVVYRIALIDIEDRNIVVYWQGGSKVGANANHGKGNKTTFSNFVNGGMEQLPATFDDGSKSSARSFHRC